MAILTARQTSFPFRSFNPHTRDMMYLRRRIPLSLLKHATSASTPRGQLPAGSCPQAIADNHSHYVQTTCSRGCASCRPKRATATVFRFTDVEDVLVPNGGIHGLLHHLPIAARARHEVLLRSRCLRAVNSLAGQGVPVGYLPPERRSWIPIRRESIGDHREDTHVLYLNSARTTRPAASDACVFERLAAIAQHATCG